MWSDADGRIFYFDRAGRRAQFEKPASILEAEANERRRKSQFERQNSEEATVQSDLEEQPDAEEPTGRLPMGWE